MRLEFGLKIWVNQGWLEMVKDGLQKYKKLEPLPFKGSTLILDIENMAQAGFEPATLGL